MEYIADLVMKDMQKRADWAREHFSDKGLEAGASRRTLADLYEELLDACIYVRNEMEKQKNVATKTLSAVEETLAHIDSRNGSR